MEDGKEILQWHPAFYAALQVELTLTFAVSRYPREVLKQLRAEERHIVEEAEKGIYYVKGSLVPIQIIVLSQLSAEKNLWFRVLTDKLRDRKIASRMLAEYEKHRENSFCSSVMDVVVRANEKMFKEEENEMCELLEQIIDEKVDKRVAEILKRKEQEAIQEGRQEGIREGRQEGIQEGIKEGMRILKNVVRRLQKMNLSTEQIAYVMEENVETVEAWLAEA